VPIVAASLRKSLLDFLLDIALYIVFLRLSVLRFVKLQKIINLFWSPCHLSRLFVRLSAFTCIRTYPKIQNIITKCDLVSIKCCYRCVLAGMFFWKSTIFLQFSGGWKYNGIAQTLKSKVVYFSNMLYMLEKVFGSLFFTELFQILCLDALLICTVNLHKFFSFMIQKQISRDCSLLH